MEHIGFNNEIYNYGRYKTNKRAKIDIKKVLFNLKRVLKKNGVLLITIPFGKKGLYENMQQFGHKDLRNILSYLKFKKKDIIYYAFYNNKWQKVSEKNVLILSLIRKKLERKKLFYLQIQLL